MDAITQYLPFLSKREGNRIQLFLFAIPLSSAFFAFPISYVSNVNVWVGLGLFFYALRFHGTQRFSVEYFALSLALAVVASVYHVRMFYFLSLGCYVLFLLELMKGKVNALPLFVLLFMSPVFQHVALTFGFPVRLQLSEWAGSLLQLGGWEVQVEGNCMLLQGERFSVDDACMGLNMLAMSLLMGVFLLAHRSKTENKSLFFLPLLFFFSFAFALNLVSNLVRIVLLVLFKIAPENPLHELLGVLCLVVYVILPLWFASQWMVRRWGKHMPLNSTSSFLSLFKKLGLLPVSITLSGLGIYIGQTREHLAVAPTSIHLEGCIETHLKDGISQFQKEDFLLYVKPIAECFTGEHTPLICWKGSGYTFQGVQRVTLSGQEVYFGQLKKKNELLYTAWWYDNGHTKTIDQWEWRWQMLKGEKKFCLINLSSAEEAKLKQQVVSLLHTPLIH